MRIDSSVTSLSWIPSEAVTGLNKAVFHTGFVHYDAPPPVAIDDLESLRAQDRFRFANHLAAWVEVEGGRVVDGGYAGGCVMGSTTLAVGGASVTFAAVALPVITDPVGRTGTAARFVQTVGGRTALPAPRRVSRAPFVQFKAPTVWTTLALTIHADGRAEHELLGASPFPRHWVYDTEGNLAAKAGLADFDDWSRNSFGAHTPWGDEESEVLVTNVESALERELSGRIMRGRKRPTILRVSEGDVITEQGSPGGDLYLLLNGVLVVEVDREVVAEVGPGAVLGERCADPGVVGALHFAEVRQLFERGPLLLTLGVHGHAQGILGRQLAGGVGQGTGECHHVAQRAGLQPSPARRGAAGDTPAAPRLAGHGLSLILISATTCPH